MSRNYFIAQLEKKYLAVLRDRIKVDAFASVILWGGKAKPKSTVQLYEDIAQFQEYEKKESKLGWTINWEEWSSKKYGRQVWPASIQVSTIEDYLFLTGKENEFAQFEKQLDLLIAWQPSLTAWLVERPEAILRYNTAWDGIMAVVDYFLKNNPDGHYLRSLPVPVHTKFIETYERIIVSLLSFLAPSQYPDEQLPLERAAGLLPRPLLFTLRWLDMSTANTHGFSMEILGLSPETLRTMDWPVKEIWLVENETALYILPHRENAVAIWSRGKAVALLSDIPFFRKAQIYYWGDMDEDGYFMLSQCRKLYPYTHSLFMDKHTLLLHKMRMTKQPAAYASKMPEQLFANEQAAFDLLQAENGRIEQEQLPQKYIADYITALT